MTNSKQSFADDFKDRIAKIEADAKSIGLNWTSICKEAGLSRATPDRWKKRVPKTIEVVTKMEEIVERHKAQASAA